MREPDLASLPTSIPKRPVPPAGLPATGRRVWTSIVNDYRPGHFSAANLELLEQFCRARALAAQCDGRIAKEGLLRKGKPHPLLNVRAQAWAEVRACATKLRLAISSTMRADSAEARSDPAAAKRKPWERSA